MINNNESNESKRKHKKKYRYTSHKCLSSGTIRSAVTFFNKHKIKVLHLINLL